MTKNFIIDSIIKKQEAVIKKINKKMLAGLLVGGLFLYLTLRQIDFSSCWKYIMQAKLFWILPAFFIYPMGFVLRGFRWKYLLMPIKIVSGTRLIFLLIIGFFMNNLLPLRLGELIRANVAGQKLSITRSSTLATIVIERLFDGLTYVFMFLITIIFLPFPAWAKKSMFFGGTLFVGGIIALFFLAKHQETAVKLLNKIPIHAQWLKKLESILLNFIKGLGILSHTRLLFIIFFLSVFIWSLEGSVFFTFTRAFSLNLNLFQCFFVMIVVGMGAILPPAPGYVGTVEFLGVTALSFVGVNKNQGFGLIITLHLFQILTIVFMGIFSMIKEKITISELINIEKRIDDDQSNVTA